MIAVFAALGPAIFAGTISGNVVDAANHPVASAIVTMSEGAASRSTPPAFHGGSTQTATDGSFSFTNLEAGTYLLCAQVPHGTLLNPCQWTTTLPQAALASATSTAEITLTMRPGYRLPIRVDDAQGLLNAREGLTPGAHLLIGANGRYHFEVANVDSTDAAGCNLSLLVPFDTPATITVRGGFFKLQDAAGNALGTALPVTVSSAVPSGGLEVKVVGTN